MSGRKTAVTNSIIFKVKWLDDASQTVRLALGSSDEGSMKGKMLRPAVAMMAATPVPLATKAPPARRAARRKGVNARAATATIGAANIHGNVPELVNQAPVRRVTILRSGFDGPSCGRCDMT